MGFLFGRRALALVATVAAAAAFWRWRSARRAKLDFEWESEVSDAIEEGRAEGRIGSAPPT